MLIKLGAVCIGKRRQQCRYTPHSPNTKMHWALKAQWTNAWKEEIGWAVLSHHRQLGKLPKEHVTLEVQVYQVRPMDTDNLYASVKPIIDGLKVNGGCGLIVDDNQKHLTLSVTSHQVKHRADEGVFLVIS